MEREENAAGSARVGSNARRRAAPPLRRHDEHGIGREVAARRAPFRASWLPYALIAPQLAVTLVFFFWPAAVALAQSVSSQDPFGLSTTFAGIANFRAIFADPLYLASFQTTLVFSAVVTVAALALALPLAATANRVTRGGRLYQTLLIWPYAVPPGIAAVLWAFLFNPSIGIITGWLRHAGIVWNHALNPGQAMLLIIIASVWGQVSYNFVFFFAGLQAIPKSLLEAAAIDGAGPLRRFVSVVVPLLAPTTFFLVVVNVIYAFFDTFPIVDAATAGGPGQATETLIYRIYAEGFKGLDLGSSAAQSVVLMTIVIVLTIVGFRVVDRRAGAR